jgi:hypothetical protein
LEINEKLEKASRFRGGLSFHQETITVLVLHVDIQSACCGSSVCRM